MPADEFTLLPSPRRREERPGRTRLPREVGVHAIDAVPLDAVNQLASDLERLGYGARRVEPRDAGIRLFIDRSRVSAPASYELDVNERGIHVVAGDPVGLRHGLATLRQWLTALPGERQEGFVVEGVHLSDGPEFPHRGFTLDVSRDRVPTMATVGQLVERLAGFKYNQLQLYMEHTFAYDGHEIVWQDASPFTGDEIDRLDADCHARGIELVPNQNSFGHFHRWLRHARYRSLAECPEGVKHPFGDEPEPFSLAATEPRALDLLEDLYDQLLPHFRSRQFNVGLDETFDLGLGASKKTCVDRGRERVYLDFLKSVHLLVSRRDRRMQFWGDIIVDHPKLIGQLPQDVLALEWGYEADHPFAEHGRRFADSGLEFHVCPGTSSWNSLGGRASNALANIRNAAVNGRDHGATGLLLTDWGDFGHLQPLPVSYPGIVIAAELAWRPDRAKALDLDKVAALLDRHIFRDPAGALGRAVIALGDCHLELGTTTKNGTPLFFLLLFPADQLDHRRYRGMTIQGLERTAERITAARVLLGHARPEAEDGALVIRELEWVADALETATQIGIARLKYPGPITSLPKPQRQEIAHRADQLIASQRKMWPQRSRPDGMEDALKRLWTMARI